MTPSRENQENEGTAISSEPSRPTESLSLPQQQQQRRSARRRSIHPNFMEAAANDSMIAKRRKLANKEEKAQAVVPAENFTGVDAADTTPRKPAANEKEPSTSTRKSTRKCSTAATKDKPSTPLSTRKFARKVGKVEADEESKIVASTPPTHTERVGQRPPSALKSARKPQQASAFAKSEKFAGTLTRSDSLSQESCSGISAAQINETAQKLFDSEEFQVLDRVRKFK